MNLFDTNASPIPPLEKVGTPITAPIEEGPVDLIPGLLPRKGQLVIAGETNVGKSLVALEICSALITGGPLWGELQPTAQAKKILYILGEHYNEVIQRLWQYTHLPMTDQVYLIGPEQLGYDKWLVVNGRPNPTGINKLTRWSEGVDLVVFDPLAAFVSGVDTENDNITMRLVLDSMSVITQRTGASCLILAHQGKPMMDKFGAEHSRKSYAIRGASGIEDAATNIFYLSMAEKGSSQAAQETADTKILSLRCRKYKGLAPEEYKLSRDENTLVHTLLGNRPHTEVRAMETKNKSGRLQAAFPEMKTSEIIKILAAINNQSDNTIRSYLAS
jgi:RecA-family ATPase